MPKRVPKDEKPFRPVATALVQRVMSTTAVATEPRVVSETPAPAHEPPRHVPAEAWTPREEKVIPIQKTERPRENVKRAETEPSAEKPPLRLPQERFYLSTEEKHEFSAALLRLSKALGTPVKSSNFLRSLIILCKRAEDSIVRRAEERKGHFYRPANANQVATADFEERLAQVLSVAFHDSPPMRDR